MAFSKTFKREVEVAFSKHSQPVWFRILKYVLLALVFWIFWGNATLWIIMAILFVFSMFLHFWYRYKTRGWTKSYGMWDYDKNRPGNDL